MRAKMLVDARVFREIVDGRPIDSDPDHPLKDFTQGQLIEGPDAEYQVALGNAEALPEPEASLPELEAPAEAPKKPKKAKASA